MSRRFNIFVRCHRRFDLLDLSVCSLKWLTLTKKTKKIFFSHVIKIYKSKLLGNLQIIFLSHFCSQHMIASFITSVVVCIIDYSTTIIKILSTLHCKSVYQFFLFFLSLSFFWCWYCESWRDDVNYHVFDFSFHSILLFQSFYQFTISVHCTNILLI